jgi:hypothetical protein
MRAELTAASTWRSLSTSADQLGDRKLEVGISIPWNLVEPLLMGLSGALENQVAH